MIGEELVSRIGEPRGVPEFERIAQIFGKLAEEFGEQRRVKAQRGRKLEEDRAKPPRGAKRIDGLQEEVCRLLRVLELQDMGDPHIRLGGERKTRLSGVHPAR